MEINIINNSDFATILLKCSIPIHKKYMMSLIREVPTIMEKYCYWLSSSLWVIDRKFNSVEWFDLLNHSVSVNWTFQFNSVWSSELMYLFYLSLSNPRIVLKLWFALCDSDHWRNYNNIKFHNTGDLKFLEELCKFFTQDIKL